MIAFFHTKTFVSGMIGRARSYLAIPPALRLKIGR
jgi:hypothetical protein